MNFFFRVDSSEKMGSGHLMRCLTLAEQLISMGENVFFICQKREGNLIKFIEGKGFYVFQLDEISKDINFEDWQNYPQEKDAESTIKILKKIPDNKYVVVDHYSLNIRWEQRIRPFVSKILVIDDLANRPHDCDLLIDQNYYCDYQSRYDELVPKECKLLLGPKFALLRSEFYRIKKSNRNGIIKKVLIFFGGSDPTNTTLKVVNSISNRLFSDIKFAVVTGQSNANKEQIKTICKLFHNIEYYDHVDNFHLLMNESDLIIGAGGINTWERCYLGIPTLLISIADNQVKIALHLHHLGVLQYMGHHNDVDEKMINTSLLYLFSNKSLVESMVKNSYSLMSENKENYIYKVMSYK